MPSLSDHRTTFVPGGYRIHELTQSFQQFLQFDLVRFSYQFFRNLAPLLKQLFDYHCILNFQKNYTSDVDGDVYRNVKKNERSYVGSGPTAAIKHTNVSTGIRARLGERCQSLRRMWAVGRATRISGTLSHVYKTIRM